MHSHYSESTCYNNKFYTNNNIFDVQFMIKELANYITNQLNAVAILDSAYRGAITLRLHL